MIFFMSFIYGTPPPTPSTLHIRIRVRIKIRRIRNIISLVDGMRVVNLLFPVILILFLLVVGIMGRILTKDGQIQQIIYLQKLISIHMIGKQFAMVMADL